jgi:hypothetical protein
MREDKKKSFNLLIIPEFFYCSKSKVHSFGRDSQQCLWRIPKILTEFFFRPSPISMKVGFFESTHLNLKFVVLEKNSTFSVRVESPQLVDRVLVFLRFWAKHGLTFITVTFRRIIRLRRAMACFKEEGWSFNLTFWKFLKFTRLKIYEPSNFGNFQMKISLWRPGNFFFKIFLKCSPENSIRHIKKLRMLFLIFAR